VVSRGGRPDLAGPALIQVGAPTLLLVGELDLAVRDLNEQARNAMTAVAEVRIVPGATHLFEEPGALDVVADEAAAWFGTYL
jgi:pimeloyl-ACP methyl ester carboxylesterase